MWVSLLKHGPAPPLASGFKRVCALPGAGLPPENSAFNKLPNQLAGESAPSPAGRRPPCPRAAPPPPLPPSPPCRGGIASKAGSGSPPSSPKPRRGSRRAEGARGAGRGERPGARAARREGAARAAAAATGHLDREPRASPLPTKAAERRRRVPNSK